jgi:hypothetical protein
MKASELRIGNLVYVSDNETNIIFKQITPINIHNLMHLTKWDKSPIDIEFEPIPLTEEWLLKLAFKKDGTNAIFWTLNNVDVWELNGVFANDLDLPIQYIHQLQNLYFALTGKELDYEEEF